ncbi:MAG: hypothetical protein OCU22_07135 [Canidatus Methanoxibalbensis ujae]|nr:hypothetical protein [Candidatus Methanoxibalbensis ujae]
MVTISEMMVKQGHWITAAAFCMMHYRRPVRPCGMRELNEEKRRIILREQFINPDHVHLLCGDVTKETVNLTEPLTSFSEGGGHIRTVYTDSILTVYNQRSLAVRGD